MHVVLARPVPDSPLVAPLTGHTPLDRRADEAAVDDETLRSLLGSSLSLSADDDLSRHVAQMLRRMPVPPLFRTSPWLRRCRAHVLGDEGTVVGTVRVVYRTGFGLRMDSVEVADR
ncbi:hypothetical protein [Streptomyces sp. NPDC001250]|uniref:hypothetical protein n=1 Tax=Streptomyces sp. NPDC001250 TaxID=3154382 RepID=UPI003334604C